jgi:hypothetical protein
MSHAASWTLIKLGYSYPPMSATLGGTANADAFDRSLAID